MNNGIDLPTLGALIAFGGFGICFLTFVFWYSARAKAARGARTTGIVVEVVVESDLERGLGTSPAAFTGHVAWPIVEFKTEAGQAVRFKASVGGVATPTVGSVVDVAYDPERPAETASLLSANTLTAIVFGCVGLGFTLVGVALFGIGVFVLRK